MLPLRAKFRVEIRLAPPPTIALNIGQILTGRPGIALQQGERALWSQDLRLVLAERTYLGK